MSAPLLPKYYDDASTTTVVELPSQGTSYGALSINLQSREKSSVQRLFDDYMYALDVSPLRTKMLTVGSVTALSATLASLLKDPNPIHLNLRLLVSMFIIGVTINAPAYHFLYEQLEISLPTSRKINVLLHLFVDQIVAGPIYIFFYIFLKSLLLGTLTLTSFLTDLGNQFWPILKLMWLIYPITQTVNFAFVPPKFRVLFNTLIAFGVNTLMAYCFVASEDTPSKVSEMIRIPFA